MIYDSLLALVVVVARFLLLAIADAGEGRVFCQAGSGARLYLFALLVDPIVFSLIYAWAVNSCTYYARRDWALLLVVMAQALYADKIQYDLVLPFMKDERKQLLHAFNHLFVLQFLTLACVQCTSFKFEVARITFAFAAGLKHAPAVLRHLPSAYRGLPGYLLLLSGQVATITAWHAFLKLKRTAYIRHLTRIRDSNPALQAKPVYKSRVRVHFQAAKIDGIDLRDVAGRGVEAEVVANLASQVRSAGVYSKTPICTVSFVQGCVLLIPSVSYIAEPGHEAATESDPVLNIVESLPTNLREKLTASYNAAKWPFDVIASGQIVSSPCALGLKRGGGLLTVTLTMQTSLLRRPEIANRLAVMLFVDNVRVAPTAEAWTVEGDVASCRLAFPSPTTGACMNASVGIKGQDGHLERMLPWSLTIPCVPSSVANEISNMPDISSDLAHLVSITVNLGRRTCPYPVAEEEGLETARTSGGYTSTPPTYTRETLRAWIEVAQQLAEHCSSEGLSATASAIDWVIVPALRRGPLPPLAPFHPLTLKFRGESLERRFLTRLTASNRPINRVAYGVWTVATFIFYARNKYLGAPLGSLGAITALLLAPQDLSKPYLYPYTLAGIFAAQVLVTVSPLMYLECWQSVRPHVSLEIVGACFGTILFQGLHYNVFRLFALISAVSKMYGIGILLMAPRCRQQDQWQQILGQTVGTILINALVYWRERKARLDFLQNVAEGKKDA